MRTLASHLLNTAGSSKQYAPVLSYLLIPVALTGYALALWRLGADLDWTADFFVSDGIFSKWQVWLALAMATQAGAHHLSRRAGRPDDAAGA
jgi:hypothetical protein